VKSVLITGASGFIARHLAKLLKSHGYRVVGTTTKSQPRDDCDRVLLVRLGDSITPALEGERFTAVVHTANYEGPDEYSVNVGGTTRWLNELRDSGAGLQIFLSSLSADSPMSDYGRAKAEIENRIAAADGINLRLGVVIGNGGMFERMRASLERSPLLPLLDNGTAPVHVLGIDFLCDVAHDCIASDGRELRRGIWHLQQPHHHTLNEVLTSIRRHYRYHCRFVPVPSLPILWAVTAAEKLGLRLPVTSANLRGLRAGRHQQLPSDFARFGYPEQSLDELVAAAAEAARSQG